MIDCIHWRDHSRPDCGVCLKRLFGGIPSHGTCRLACREREPLPAGFVRPPPLPIQYIPEETPATAQSAVAGACGCAKLMD